MRRRVVNVLVLVSAVVCVLSLSVVGRSFFRVDEVAVPMGQRYTCGAQCADGQLILANVPISTTSYHIANSSPPNSDSLWRELKGIRWLGIGWGRPFGQRVLILPLWVVPIVTGILPVWWWRVRRRAGGRGFAVEVKGSSPATEETAAAK